MSRKLPDIRRIVTGHDHSGKAVIIEQGALAHVTHPPTQPGLAFHEIWNTNQMPMPIGFTQADPTEGLCETAPPAGGTIIRIVDIPAEGRNGPGFDKSQAEELFAAVGLAENAKHTLPGRHPLMHRTESIDYGVVLAGEIVLVLDEDEINLRPGDVVVQRGTIHAWANRSNQICRMLFVLTDGRLEPNLASAIAKHDRALLGDEV